MEVSVRRRGFQLFVRDAELADGRWNEGVGWRRMEPAADRRFARRAAAVARVRIGVKQKDGGYQCPRLSDGFMIWIQRAEAAAEPSTANAPPPK